MQGAFYVRHPVAVFLLASTLVMGGLVGVALTSWAGRPVFEAPREVPIFRQELLQGQEKKTPPAPTTPALTK